MAQSHKAYVVINAAYVGSPAGVGFSYVVIEPDGTASSGQLTTSTGFEYGDSNNAIRQKIVDSIRVTVGDPDLDVNFITG